MLLKAAQSGKKIKINGFCIEQTPPPPDPSPGGPYRRGAPSTLALQPAALNIRHRLHPHPHAAGRPGRVLALAPLSPSLVTA